MSTRLHVVLADDENARYRACAERAGVTFSTWVRMALALAEREQPRKTVDQRLAALQRALEIPEDERLPMPPVEEYLAWHGRSRYGELPEP
jgi:hypothetical protein